MYREVRVARSIGAAGFESIFSSLRPGLVDTSKKVETTRKETDTYCTSAVASVNIIRDTYRRNSVNNKCRYHSDRIDVLGSIDLYRFPSSLYICIINKICSPPQRVLHNPDAALLNALPHFLF